MTMTGGIASYTILQAIEDAMRAWVESNHGVMSVAHDPAEALDLLASQVPKNWRLIIGVDNEDSAEEYPARTGASHTEFFFTIQTGTTLQANASDQVHRERGPGIPSIMEIAEAVRSHVRGLRFNHPAMDCQIGFSWKGSAWVSLKEDGKPSRFARQHHFIQLHLVEPPADLEPITLT
jgi:hypothetical protein